MAVAQALPRERLRANGHSERQIGIARLVARVFGNVHETNMSGRSCLKWIEKKELRPNDFLLCIESFAHETNLQMLKSVTWFR
jgi:hypothetical protein